MGIGFGVEVTPRAARLADTIDAERAPVVTVHVVGDEVPAATEHHELRGLDEAVLGDLGPIADTENSTRSTFRAAVASVANVVGSTVASVFDQSAVTVIFAMFSAR